MLEYIFLVIAAIIVFPVLYYLMTKGKAGKSVVVMAAAGFLIVLAGVYLQDRFAFYYAVLAMIGLAFAAGVLIDKRMGDAAVADGIEEVVREPIRLGGEPEEAASRDETPDITPAEVREAILHQNDDTIEPIETGIREEPALDDLFGMKEIVLPGTADIVHPPQLEEDEPEKANPAEVVKAAGDAGRYDYTDGLDVIGTDEAGEISRTNIGPEEEAAVLGDDDYIDPSALAPASAPGEESDELPGAEDLEMWLSSRPLIDEETSAEPDPEPADDLSDYNPFDLLEDDDFIAEEDEDGKQ
ncbi:hypothetical protein ACFFIY_11545 [Bhargavaea ullalensis]|uniref:Uncharacterized protein n=1 Tax=Bhargavaea ullalensis TaxID=1265685 RepID=A0ABV2G8L7_9BACL